MTTSLRVALFSDSFHEHNGVSTVCREFAGYADRHGVPFCCVHSGPVTATRQNRSVMTVELKRGFTFKLDQDLYCDPFLSRYRNHVLAELKKFQPDVIHITGPGDMGILGFWISNLMGVPMVASWHTNLHEYASRRVSSSLASLPYRLRAKSSAAAEHHSLRALTAFYKLAHFTVAPNQEMVDMLYARTGRPSYHMKHGVDVTRFGGGGLRHDGKFCIGWVGRLTPEKNVRAFAELEAQLHAAGERDFRLLLVGDGSEREWLRKRLPDASMPGFLIGDELVQAFQSMDAFVFPSKTDTFGLVILEAMASGVPVVLSAEAGERVGIQDGREGFCSGDLAQDVLRLLRDKALCKSMGSASAQFARAKSWNGVFDDLYETYDEALEHPDVLRRLKRRKLAMA